MSESSEMTEEEFEQSRQVLINSYVDLFKKGDYSFFAYHKEKKIYNIGQIKAFRAIFIDHKINIGYGGGAGGGKSIVMCYILCLCCLSYPDTAWGLARKTLTSLKKTTLISFYEVCEFLSLKSGVDFVYNEKASKITFPKTNAVVWLSELSYRPSDPEYSNLGGLLLTGAFVDESNECPKKAIATFLSRTNRRNGAKYGINGFIFESFNPNKGHVYEKYYKPFKENKMPNNTTFIPALATGNPFVEDAYLDTLKALPPILRARLYEGNFDYDDTPTRLIYDYNSLANMFSTVGDHQNGRFITADIAMQGADKFVVYLWHGLYVKKTWVKDKISGAGVEALLKEIAKDYNVPADHIVYDADGLGAFLEGYLHGAIPFHNGAKPIPLGRSIRNKEKYSINYGSLKDQCYYKLAEMINDGHIGIYEPDEDARTDLMDELSILKNPDPFAKKTTIQNKASMKEDLGRSPDRADAMAMRMYFEVQKPRRPKGVNPPPRFQKLKPKFKF